MRTIVAVSFVAFALAGCDALFPGTLVCPPDASGWINPACPVDVAGDVQAVDAIAHPNDAGDVERPDTIEPADVGDSGDATDVFNDATPAVCADDASNGIWTGSRTVYPCPIACASSVCVVFEDRPNCPVCCVPPLAPVQDNCNGPTLRTCNGVPGQCVGGWCCAHP